MPKVLIIGGGICGLTTAAALKAIGFDVFVFERSHELREVGAGLTLWSNGVKALKQISLDEAAIQAGQVVQNFKFFNERGRELGGIDMSKVHQEIGFPSVSIHRMDLMKVLEKGVDPSIVQCGHELESFSQDTNSVTVKFANGRTESGDLLLACDGFSSRVRNALIPSEKKAHYCGYTCWRGVAEVPEGFVPPGAVLHYLGRGTQLGILDVGTNKVCWYLTGNVPEGRSESAEERKSEVAARVAKYPGSVPELMKLTHAKDYLKNDIFDRDPVDTWSKGRVLLLGDAAHPTTPNLGQGACMAIEDGIRLAECLKGNSDFAVAFSKFSRERQKRTSRIVLSSRRVGDMSQIENSLACYFRDFSFELMLKSGGLADFDYAVYGII